MQVAGAPLPERFALAGRFRRMIVPAVGTQVNEPAQTIWRGWIGPGHDKLGAMRALLVDGFIGNRGSDTIVSFQV
ncbi:MAG TPA: hypothetical protein VMU90_00180, partial [Solirubrobacteraceae bacterium]|nr:hypothetical protein [Solirubrobacteraceae bacterium]